MRFTKMHGIGNDYIYINAMEEIVYDPEALAVRLSQRHFGVGADGLVLIDASDSADLRMRIFNADGSEAETCGNALRCVCKYAYERGLTEKTELTIETLGGICQAWLDVDGGAVRSVRVDMGSPELNPARIPVDLPGETVLNYRLQLMGQAWFMSCVSMGNPHAVLFVRDPEVLDLSMVGAILEHHKMFPQRANIEFVRVIDRGHMQMRVWERGSGETMACCSGACAALVAGVLTGRCDRKVEMKLPGGMLNLHWNADDNHVYQSGTADFVFDGEIAD